MNNENGIRFWLVSYKFCFTFLFSNLRFQYGLADTFLVFQLFAFHQISANPIGLRPSICMPLSSLFLTGAARERRQEYDQPPLEERRELWSNRRPQASRRLIHSWWQMLDWMSDRFLEKHLSSEQESPASLSLSLQTPGDSVHDHTVSFNLPSSRAREREEEKREEYGWCRTKVRTAPERQDASGPSTVQHSSQEAACHSSRECRRKVLIFLCCRRTLLREWNHHL